MQFNIRSALIGIAFAVLTLLYGFTLGINFGYNEDVIKEAIHTSGMEVLATKYNNDEAALKKVTDKSWTYLQRAHLHAGGLGAASLCLIIVTVLIGTKPLSTRIISIALGAGSLGYANFWALAAFMAPELGSTGAAKETLNWLAMPTSSAVVLATVWVFVLVVKKVFSREG